MTPCAPAQLDPLESTLQNALRRAAVFFRNHPKNPKIGNTFGYFTHHPVAPLNRQRLRLLLSELQQESQRLGRTLRILDLACGGGLISATLAGLGHRVVGMDFDAEEIALAHQFTKLGDGSDSNPTFLQADLLGASAWEERAYEALGGKPDVIVLAYALHHLPQVEEFALRLGRWLHSGALLLINEENPRSPLFRLKHLVRGWMQRDTDTEWHRSMEEWAKILQRAGFEPPTKSRGADLLPPAFCRAFPKLCWSLVFTTRRG